MFVQMETRTSDVAVVVLVVLVVVMVLVLVSLIVITMRVVTVVEDLNVEPTFTVDVLEKGKESVCET